MTHSFFPSFIAVLSEPLPLLRPVRRHRPPVGQDGRQAGAASAGQSGQGRTKPTEERRSGMAAKQGRAAAAPPSSGRMVRKEKESKVIELAL